MYFKCMLPERSMLCNGEFADTEAAETEVVRNARRTEAAASLHLIHVCGQKPHLIHVEEIQVEETPQAAASQG